MTDGALKYIGEHVNGFDWDRLPFPSAAAQARGGVMFNDAIAAELPRDIVDDH